MQNCNRRKQNQIPTSTEQNQIHYMASFIISRKAHSEINTTAISKNAIKHLRMQIKNTQNVQLNNKEQRQRNSNGVNKMKLGTQDGGSVTSAANATVALA